MRAEFDESLVTGNEMIDSQHKELIDKINKLLDSCETSKDKVVSVKTLDYLASDISYISLAFRIKRVYTESGLMKIARTGEFYITR